jgi:hypothetical protein
MIYPNVSVKDWVNRLTIDFSDVCEECGHPFKTMRPYIKQDYAGVACFCEQCDENVYIYVPYSQRMKNLIKENQND